MQGDEFKPVAGRSSYRTGLRVPGRYAAVHGSISALRPAPSPLSILVPITCCANHNSCLILNKTICVRS
jgi:hypothetical protein